MTTSGRSLPNRSQLDLAFLIDCTTSMNPFINSVRKNIGIITNEIGQTEKSDIRLALVEFRDHPPEEKTFVTRVHKFTDQVSVMEARLAGCKAEGGGDEPEAIADALHDALHLEWRDSATKICILISDAPPHGLGKCQDNFPDGCPCLHDPDEIVQMMGNKEITLYVAGVEPTITPYREYFQKLVSKTGGQYVPLKDATSLTGIIIGSAREEISIKRVTENSRDKILGIVNQANTSNSDDKTVIKQIQDQLRGEGATAHHLSNEATNGSQKTDDAHSKYGNTDHLSSVQQRSSSLTSSHQDTQYGVIENSPVSFEQAGRILQRARNWSPQNSSFSNQSTVDSQIVATKDSYSSSRQKPAFSPREVNPFNKTPAPPEGLLRSSDMYGSQRSTGFPFGNSNTPRNQPLRAERNDDTQASTRYRTQHEDQTEEHRDRFSRPKDDHSSQKSGSQNRHSVNSSDQIMQKRGNDRTQMPCRYGAKCWDQSDEHRNRFSHPKDDHSSQKSGSQNRHSVNSSDQIMQKRSSDGIQVPCRYGAKCWDQSDEHRDRFSHPKDDHGIRRSASQHHQNSDVRNRVVGNKQNDRPQESDRFTNNQRDRGEQHRQKFSHHDSDGRNAYNHSSSPEEKRTSSFQNSHSRDKQHESVIPRHSVERKNGYSGRCRYGSECTDFTLEHRDKYYH